MPPSEKQLVPRKKIFGLDRNIFMLGLTSFFNDVSSEMVLSSFPAFFTSVLKSGAASLGLVEGIADGAANLLKIYSGQLSDRLRRRRIFILVGYAMSVSVRPFYIFMSSIGGVLGLRVIDRVGKGVRDAPRDVIISVSSEPGEVGRSFGYHRAMDTVGGILGPLIAFIILSQWPGAFNAVFMTAFFIGLLSVVTVLFVKDVFIAPSVNSTMKFSFKALATLPPRFKIYLVSIFILSIGSLPTAVLLLSVLSIGLSVASIPLFYMVYGISFAAFSYGSGKMSDGIGTSRVLVFGYVLLMLSYLMFVLSQTIPTLVISFITLGIFSACTDSTQRAFVAKATPESERGTAYGVFNAVVGFGVMFAGIIGGYLWQYAGPVTALFIAILLVLVGLVVFFTSAKVGRDIA
jgi:MFS family permease